MNNPLKPLARSLLLLGLSALAACNDNHSALATPILTPAPAPAPSSIISGVAATGAAISNGTVALRCGGGVNVNASSGSNGAWMTSVPTASMPCAVKVSGGTVAGIANTATFYSIARSPSGTASTANLTPIGDLALAAAVTAAVGRSLDAWYMGATDAQVQQVADGIAAAVANLRTALSSAGYSLPSAGFDPFTAAIIAGGATDAYDLLLEAYKRALADAGRSYEAARSNYTAGGGIAANPTTSTPPPTGNADVSGPLTATGSASATEFLGKLAGDYQLLVSDAYAAGESEFPKNSVHAVQMKSDGTVSIRGSSKTLSYLYVQKTLSDYTQESAGTAAEKDTLRFYAANGSGIDLFITYEPGQGYLTMTPQGFTGESEGGATLVSKKGTAAAPETPSNPPAVTGKGVLGTALKNVFAGDYVLKCSVSPGQPVRSFAFSLAADGSSLFEGAALVDASHAGRVETEGTQSSAITLSFKPSASNSAYVVLGFKADGTFYPNSVFVPGQPNGQVYSCFSNSGHTAPPSSARAISTISAAAAALARSETVSCTQGGATAPQTLTINSDGSAQLGAQTFTASNISKITDDLLFATTKKATLSYADFSTGKFRSLTVDVDTDLKTTGVLASVGTGSGDIIVCKP